MRLDEEDWILSRGVTRGWRAVAQRREELALRALAQARRGFAARAPAAARRLRFSPGLDFALSARGAARRILSHPALDYWQFLWERHFQAEASAEDWRRHFGLFQGLALGAAAAAGASLEVDAVLDDDAHLHVYGPSQLAAFPRSWAWKTVRVRVRRGGLDLPAGGVLRPALVVGGGLSLETCGPLITRAVVMHGLSRPSAARLSRFGAKLEEALEQLRERDPGLLAELTDMMRCLIPLENPKRFGSVSSSYVNLRGAICLSHSEDELLQAETLIHEFCHQKMNQLLLVEPVLLPGQDGQVFYSPWRPDARRLRGLVLGAHAFLNVASYLIASAGAHPYPARHRLDILRNASRRLFEVDAALGVVRGYGRLTDFGRRFVLGMDRRLRGLFHAAQAFPPALLEEARAASDAHRLRHCLPGTGLHRGDAA